MLTAVPFALFVSAAIAMWLAALIQRRPSAPGAAPGTYAFLEVRDNGPGMDDETLRRIFNPFFTTKHSGHGLGLAAVQGIVRGHRGALHVDSNPGSGSRFCVWFPALQQAPGPRAQGPGLSQGSGVSTSGLSNMAATEALDQP